MARYIEVRQTCLHLSRFAAGKITLGLAGKHLRIAQAFEGIDSNGTATSTMKPRILICTLIAAACSISSMAQVSIRGSRSCGNWIQYQKEGGVASTASEAWLVGFLSGIAFESNKDILKGIDNPSIFLWVTNYCQANPLDGLTDAGEALAEALKKKKGIKP